MGITKPEIQTTKKFSDEIGENKPFKLMGIRTVTARSADYGEGEMIVLSVEGHGDLGVWGTYLLAQAKSAGPEDLGRHYVITRKVVPEFSSREVKCLVPANENGEPIPF